MNFNNRSEEYVCKKYKKKILPRKNNKLPQEKQEEK